MAAAIRSLTVLCALSILAGSASSRVPAAFAAAPQAQAASDALAIIVHRSNPVDDLSAAELRRIFMLERQSWPHGRKITVVLREKAQPERATAIAVICHLTDAEYERHVLLQTFRGSVGWGPRSILSSSAMMRFIFDVPGAIGVVRADEPDGSVKVLRIDGLLPADARYALRSKPARQPPEGLGVHP